MQTLSLRSEMEWMRLFPGKINITLKFHGFPGKDEVSFQSDSRATIKNLKDQICRQILNSDESSTGAKLRIRQMQTKTSPQGQFHVCFLQYTGGSDAASEPKVNN